MSDTRGSNRANLKSFWNLAGPNQRTFKLSFAVMFLTLATEVVRPFVLERGIKAMESGNLDILKNAALLFLGLIVMDYISRSFFTYLFSMGLLKTINKIRGKIFGHVIHMRLAFFDKKPVGALLTRTINDCEALGETLRAGSATIVLDMLTVVSIFIVMCTLEWGLSLSVLLCAPVIWVIVRWCAGRLREKFIDVRKALAESNGYMAEGIMGVEIFQLFQREASSSRRFGQINKKYCKATIISNVYDALLYAVMDGLAACVTALVLFIALNIQFTAATLMTDTAMLVVYLRLIEKIFIPIRDFSSKYAVIQQGIAAIERINEVLEMDDKIPMAAGTIDSDQLTVTFKDISFRYVKDGPQVLQDINFEIKPGTSLALVGQTGSGKSTIGKLLTRAYDGYDGQIQVNGVELGELNYHNLRASIAVVHQDVELFPGTLRENITMFNPNISEENIVRAIRMVKAEHMVSQLPDGLDYMVHESGANLSSGQIQLIVFARALAHDAPVILMDEATASVDSVTEAWIQEAVQQILKHKTTIIVAHRLSTIAAADNILVLKHGKIIEQGKHEELVAIDGGYYANLVHASQLKQGGQEVLL